MTDRRIIHLLWADDDSNQLLEPLSWNLEDEGFRVFRATNYLEATEVLDTEDIHSLLVDIILPPGTKGSNLGLDLAEYAAASGVKAICFLTVVLESDVSNRYQKLENKYPQVYFWFCDKLLLLEPNTIEELIEHLKHHMTA